MPFTVSFNGRLNSPVRTQSGTVFNPIIDQPILPAVSDPDVVYRYATQRAGTGQTGVSVPLPAILPVGELLVMCVVWNATTMSGTPTTGGVPWTAHGTRTDGTSTSAVFHRVAVTGDAGSTAVMNFAASTIVTAVVESFAGVVDWHVSANAADTGTDNIHELPAATSTLVGLVAHFVTVQHGGTDHPATASLPAGYVLRARPNSNTAGGHTLLAFDSDTMVPAGSVGGGVTTWDLAAANVTAWTMVLTAAPQPVLNVSSSPTDTVVNLAWTYPTNSNVTGVMIRRALGDVAPVSATAGTLVSDVAFPTSAFADTGRTPSTQYSYAFFAHDVANRYAAGVTRTVTTQTSSADTTPPGVATGLTVTSKTDVLVAIGWTNPTDSDFAGTNVYRDGTLLYTVPVPGSQFFTTDHTPSTTYTYGVRTFDVDGNLAAMVSVSVTTDAAPAAIGNFDAGTVLGSTSYTRPSGSVYVDPDDGLNTNSGTEASPFATLARAVTAAPSGTSIVLRGGAYEESTVTIPATKTGLTIQSYPGERPLFTGSQVVSGFVADGARWKRTGWVTQFDHTHVASIVDPTFPAAPYPDMVWVAGVPLTQVLTQAAVTAGKFYADDAADILWIGTNPSGGVRATVRSAALIVHGAGTTVRGVGFKDYATSPTFQAAVRAEDAASVTFEHCRFEYMAQAGVKAQFSSGFTARRCTFYRCGQLGVRSQGSINGTIDRCHFVECNFERFEMSDTAGAFKSDADSTGWTVTNNLVQNSFGHGLWFDTRADNTVVTGNYCIGNTLAGIFYKDSDAAVIAGNLLVQNGSGVLMGESSNCDVYNNTFVDNDLSIEFYEGPLAAVATRCTVRNNAISHRTRGSLPVKAWDTNTVKRNWLQMQWTQNHDAVFRQSTITTPIFAFLQDGAGSTGGGNYATRATLLSNTLQEGEGLSTDNVGTDPYLGSVYPYLPKTPLELEGSPLPTNVANALNLDAGVPVTIGWVQTVPLPAQAPTITSFTPTSGPVNTSPTVTITGTNYQTGASVRFGTVAASVSSVTATQIVCAAPARATAGTVTIKVTNPDGQFVNSTSQFTYTTVVTGLLRPYHGSSRWAELPSAMESAIEVWRIYETDGTWTAPAQVRTCLAAGKIPYYSAQGNRTQANKEALARYLLASGGDIYFTWEHEPENDGGTAAEFEARYESMFSALVSQGAHVSVGGNVRMGPCFIGFNSFNQANPLIDTWIPARYDFVGIDVYDTNATKSAADLMTKALDWCNAHGVPLVIGEYSTHGTRQQRSAWIRAAHDWMAGKNIAIACFFNSQVGNRVGPSGWMADRALPAANGVVKWYMAPKLTFNVVSPSTGTTIDAAKASATYAAPDSTLVTRDSSTQAAAQATWNAWEAACVVDDMLPPAYIERMGAYTRRSLP